MATLKYGKTDADFVQGAYGAQLSKLFQVFADGTAGGTDVPTAQARFSQGLRNAKDVRDFALGLADSCQLTSAFESDAALLKDAYGDYLKTILAKFHDEYGVDVAVAKTNFTNRLAHLRDIYQHAIASLQTL